MVIVNHTSPPAERRGLHLPACGETRTSPPRSRGDADFTSPLAGRSAAQPPGGDVNYTSPRAGRRGLHLPACGEVGGAAAGWGRVFERVETNAVSAPVQPLDVIPWRTHMAIRVLILSTLIFIGAFGTHEVMHLLVIYAVGGSGSIIARPWQLGLVNFSIYSLHAAPAQPLDVTRQTI